MKNLSLKIGVLFALLLLLLNPVFANTSTSSKFMIEGADLVDTRTVTKIDEIGNELFSKTGVNVYLYLKKDMALYRFKDMKSKINHIKSVEDNLTSNLKAPFVLLSISVDDTHINLRNSPDLDGKLDKDEILDDYIIPLLASKDKNTLYAKVSAAVLNGYGAITDKVAEDKGIKLSSSMGNEGYEFNTVWKSFIYTIVVLGLLAYVYAILRSRKSR
ncbi:MAG: hypothetical protein FNT15_05990 [Sulfurovum sp.]|nr:MAG: hypothetical protein FNT15_05990 [Sulfurovum sp.]